MANKIQFKRGLKSTLPILSVGEPALCTDTGEVFIGGTSGNIGIAKASDLTGMSKLARARDARAEGMKTPQWYIDNGFKGQTLLELNIQSNVGLSGGIMCHVLSTIPWHDITGTIVQIITVADGKTYKRWSTSISTWSPTLRILDEYDTRVIQNVGQNYDLNNVTESSILRSQFLNYPVGFVVDGQGICETTVYSAGWRKQVFISPYVNHTYERIMYNNVWQPWGVNFNSSNYGAIIYLANNFIMEANWVNKVCYGGGVMTIPVNIFPIGTQITFVNFNGEFTFAPASGVTLSSKDTKRVIDGNFASATLVQLGLNGWALMGALK